MKNIDDERLENIRNYILEKQNTFDNWSKYFKQLLIEKKMTIKYLAVICGVDETTVRRWTLKPPARRQMVIGLAMSLDLDLEETNNILVRYCGFPKLYAKNAADAVVIYYIYHNKNEGKALKCEDYFKKYQEYLKKMSELLKEKLDKKTTTAPTPMIINKDTIQMNDALRVFSYESIEEFIAANRESFISQNDKIIKFMNDWLGKHKASKFVFSSERGTTLTKYISELRKYKAVPQRAQLIAIGLLFKMNVDVLNSFLESANMAKLRDSDKFENALLELMAQIKVNVKQNENKQISLDDITSYVYNNVKSEYVAEHIKYDLEEIFNFNQDNKNNFISYL